MWHALARIQASLPCCCTISLGPGSVLSLSRLAMNCSTFTFIGLSSSAVRVKSSYTMRMILSHMDASPFSASCRLLMKRLKHDVSAGIRNDWATLLQPRLVG